MVFRNEPASTNNDGDAATARCRVCHRVFSVCDMILAHGVYYCERCFEKRQGGCKHC